MTRPVANRLRLLLSVAACPLVTGAALAQDTFTGVARIVAVGDVHGDFDQFVTVLRAAGVIDGRNRWSGGKTHLVQTGDILDRGPESRKAMELLMELETQAAKAGGRVHALVGNHEAMNMIGDLRYVSAEEYRAFQTPGSEALRERAYGALADSSKRKDAEYRRQWMEEHPLGWVEHRLAFEGNGRYAAWIRGHPAVIRIDDYLFLHGGIGPGYATIPIGEINARVRQALAPTAEPGILKDGDGPLWYRGLAFGEEAPLEAHVDQVLANFGVRHIVIGHTVTPGTVIPRFAGKVILIDVGLSAVYGGPPACLVIEDGVPFTIHRGQKLALPLDGNPLPYLKAAAALDPDPSRLRKYVERLESGAAAAVPPG